VALRLSALILIALTLVLLVYLVLTVQQTSITVIQETFQKYVVVSLLTKAVFRQILAERRFVTPTNLCAPV